MSDSGLWSPLLRAPFYEELSRRLGAGEPGIALTGLLPGARALTLSLLAAGRSTTLLVVVPDDTAVEGYRRDLAALARAGGYDPGRIAVLPALDSDPYDDISPHPEVARERMVALEQIRRGEADLLLVPARALLQWLHPQDDWTAWTRTIRVGGKLPPDRFVLELLGLGYRRVDTVSGPAEVSRRGGIVDIFPPTLNEPVRVELFADGVESLRSFDTDNQRSTGKLNEVVVGPAVENPPTEEALRRLSLYLDSRRTESPDDTDVVRQLRGRLELLQQNGYWPGLEALAGLMAARPVSLFEHTRGMTLVVDEPGQVEDELLRAHADLRQAHEGSGNLALPAPAQLFIDPREIQERLSGAALLLQELDTGESSAARVSFDIACRPARAYTGRFSELAADLRKARDAGVRTVCVMRARGGAERLMEVFKEYELDAVAIEALAPRELDRGREGGVFIGLGALRAGFELPGLGLNVLCERELFGESRKIAERKSGNRAAFISDFRDLDEGDLVVHVDHGVARFTGLGAPKGGSLNRDFMLLEFAAGDRLFVPVDRLDLVQRYSGVAGHKPPLDRLGGPGWERVKSRVRKSVRSMAKELLELYARREAAVGHAFSADTPWQKELEDAFPYELTRDQERAVAEVKADMESSRVMDRLLVGDVGFGKTEVAVRAAFKAVMDGFQVALMTPTTVLAFQHSRTLAGRIAAFPVRVGMISRFRTAAENRKTLQDVELGSVDILVGTHRMLSKDVCFKRLGLLLVDEEQRFGVAHKERLKKMAVGVDVLSMTATPIPRTLQMSMAGVRDLSVIETPPPGRSAIQTYLVPFRKVALAQAIRQELRRDGQVFVVHNRVHTLPALARTIGEMAPEARIEVAHGQMPERKLEAVMLRFLRYEADVLVTTTIIENGLDIPRANTIIIDRADRFGLAQLYQLRGRVGRSEQHAYAYLIVPGREELSGEARKRLKALKDFSELGSGFRLAAADLEIRGAGELLGSRQHGHISSLGFDLYCQLLERAVQELKGEKVRDWRPPSLHLGVDIKIPEGYLPESRDRLVLYKRLAQAREIQDIDRLQAETEDRFGHFPAAAGNLFALARLRLVAEGWGIKSVDIVDSKLQVRFHDRPPIEPARVVKAVTLARGTLTPSGMMVLPAPARGEDRIAAITRTLGRVLGDGGD